MKKLLSFRLLAISLVIAIASAGCGSSSKLLSEGSSLLTSLGSNPNLSTFTSLLKTPGLSSALGSFLKEPFTLLAPTNDAFNSLSADKLETLKNPANVDQISSFLKNSIIPGKLDATSVAQAGVKTAEGTPVNLSGASLGSLISTDKFNIIPVDKILQ